MVRRTRMAAGLSLLAVLAMVAAGCSSGKKSTGTSGTNLSGKHLEVIAEWSGEEQAAFQAVLDKFQKDTHATVTYTSGGDNTSVLVNSRIAGGSPPDVALIAQPGVIAAFAQKNQIFPLTGSAATAVKNNFSQAWQQLGTINGQLYGVFFKVANKSVVWYRTDDFSSAGVQPPTTWDQFMTISKTIADSGVPAMAIPAGDGWPVTDWFENIYLRVAGADKYAQLTQHKIPWTDPTVVQSLQLLANYIKQPGVLEPGSPQLSFTQSVSDVFGDKPKAAQLYEGDFVAGVITQLGKTQVGTGAKFYNFPSINGSQPSVVSGGDEAVAFKNSPAAMALMAYLASPEAAAIWAAKGGFLSANKNLNVSTYPDDTTRSIAQALVNSSQAVFDMSDQTPQKFGGQSGADEWVALTKFIANPSNPAATAATLEAAAKSDYTGG